MAGPWDKYAQQSQEGPWTRHSTPEPQTTATAVAGNFGSGTQRGIANALGLPVDALTGAINGIGNLTGMWEPIQAPVGGSDSIYAAMEPFRAGVEAPDTAWERGAGRVGEEVGAAAAFGPASLALAPQRAGAVLATDLASSFGGGSAAAVANEYFPGNEYADIAASLAGGLTAGGVAGRVADLGGAPAVVRSGIDEQRQIARDAYAPVRADTRIIPQSEVDVLRADLANVMQRERINARLQPGAANILDAIMDETTRPVRIEDVENLRRMTQQNLPMTATPADQRLTGMMTDQITSYLDNMNDPVADSLRTGRQATRRYKAAETVQDATTRAQRRAASTGSGGNEINATRQNVRALLDNPRKSRGFTAEERASMEEVVRGTPSGNVARSLSRFAPTSGGLSAMLNVGGAVAAPSVALPIAGATELAKFYGERSTRRSVDNLVNLLAPDRVLAPSDPGYQDIIMALLAARGYANGGE